MKRIGQALRWAAAALARRLPTDGMELLGLALMVAGLWLWSPALALVVLGGLLLASALLNSASPTNRDKE